MSPSTRERAVEVPASETEGRGGADVPCPHKVSAIQVADRWLPVLGMVTQTGPNGLRITFEGPHPEAFSVGESVGMEFRWPDGREPIRAGALVCRRSDQENLRHYEVLVNWRPPDSPLGCAPEDPFAERREHRIRLDTLGRNVDLGMLVPALQRAIPGRILDISPSGVGVLLPRVADHIAARVQHVILFVHLPTLARPLQLAGFIRHRSLTRQGVIFGIEVKDADRPDCGLQQLRQHLFP